jgi:hypothetical protein
LRRRHRVGDFGLEGFAANEVVIEFDVLAPAKLDRAAVPVADLIPSKLPAMLNVVAKPGIAA